MKKIYVIGLARYGCGLVSLLTSVYNHVRYAFQNGYVPIVDFKHYDNLYFKDDRKYHDNSWEYFFEQPMQKNLNDITSETSVIISPDTHIVDEQTSIVNSGDIPETEDDILTARQKDIKENFSKYIRLNKETEDYLKKESSKILKDVHFDEILGVLYRGTDYNSNKAKFEYAQSSVNQFIENIKAFLKKNPQIKKIYLATEDDEAYQLFKNTFGNQLLDNGQYRYSSKEKEKLLFEISSNRKNHHYQLALEYLTSLFILSKCSFFMGGRCNGSLYVWLMHQGPFKYFRVPNKGQNCQRYSKALFSLGFIKLLKEKTAKSKSYILLLFGHRYILKQKARR